MIIDTIKDVRLTARKRQDHLTAKLTGVIISELDRKQDHSDDAAIKVIKSIIESNRFTLNESIPGSQQSLNIVREIAVLEQFLPEQITGGELRELVETLIKVEGYTGMKDMGKLQAKIKESVNGKIFEGKEVADYMKQFTGK